LRLTKNENGYTYDDSENSSINTLAGCINTAHDLIGMIIVDDVDDIEKASAENIYYGKFDENKVKNKFYIKYPYYKFEILDKEELEEFLNTIIPKDLIEFSEGVYYIKTNSGYQKDRIGTYKKGTLYYTIKETPIKLYEKPYEALEYYYLNNSDFLLDENKDSNDNIQYYTI
jgi:hypothetical protein